MILSNLNAASPTRSTARDTSKCQALSDGRWIATEVQEDVPGGVTALDGSETDANDDFRRAVDVLSVR